MILSTVAASLLSNPLATNGKSSGSRDVSDWCSARERRCFFRFLAKNVRPDEYRIDRARNAYSSMGLMWDSTAPSVMARTVDGPSPLPVMKMTEICESPADKLLDFQAVHAGHFQIEDQTWVRWTGSGKGPPTMVVHCTRAAMSCDLLVKLERDPRDLDTFCFSLPIDIRDVRRCKTSGTRIANICRR